MALPGGTFWATLCFVLLMVAALTSAISLLEVAASYFIDDRGWSRTQAVLVCAAATTLCGVPSALSNVPDSMWSDFFGSKNFFEGIDWAVSNVMLPLGGLGVSLFVGWRMSGQLRKASFGERTAMWYGSWLFLMQWLAPAAVIIVFLNAVGLLDLGALFGGAAEAAQTN